MTDVPDDQDNPKPKRTPRKSPSRYANATYEVGKGKTPVEHRFKPGGRPGPGRPKGSRNKSDFDTVFDEPIQIGEDRLGRPIRRSARRVGNMQLRKMVMEGNFQAIKYMKDHELKLEAITARQGEAPPTAAETRRKLEDEQEAKMTSNKLVELLEFKAQLKRQGLDSEKDGHYDLAPWVYEAVKQYIERSGRPDEIDNSGR